LFKRRTWGWWAVLWQWPLFSKGPRYKLKLLYFKKGGSISLQRHFHRTEKWFLIFGHGNVIRRKSKDKTATPETVSYGTAPIKTEGSVLLLRGGEFSVGYFAESFNVPVKFWHRFKAVQNSLILETQRGICMESDIEREV
jgi:hypothetical protein